MLNDVHFSVASITTTKKDNKGNVHQYQIDQVNYVSSIQRNTEQLLQTLKYMHMH